MDILATFLVQIGGYLRIVCEIGILAALIYSALLFVKGTRASTILVGITIVIITMSFLSGLFGLDHIEWILMKLWPFLALTVLVIFQPEIRRAFAQIGSRQTVLRKGETGKRDKELVDILMDAVFFLASHRIGALIAIEQNIGTRAFAETGTQIDAPVNRELLATIFFPNTPLHDGGVIIRNGMIVAAGCIFPLTQSPELGNALGTRHRAGVGITEETDALAIVVSEESGAVSLARRGRLTRGVTRSRLQRHLTNYLLKRSFSRSHSIRASIAELQAELATDAESDEEPIAP